jgi:hypothetical protein
MEPRPPSALEALQDATYRLIAQPGGVDAVADGAELAALVRGGAVAPAERVAVYANAWFARLHDCLHDDYGATARALGPDAFHDLVKTYLMLHAPARPSLRHAGAQLAEHLAAEPFAAIFARRCAYAADLARLEWAIAEAFAAPDAPELTREKLAQIEPEAWPALRFAAAPSLHLLDLAWPVQIARERFEREGDDAIWTEAPALPRVPTHVRVWRQAERVRFARIPALEHDLLADLRAGQSFSALCERACAQIGDAEAAARVAGLLASWTSDGLLVRSFS